MALLSGVCDCMLVCVHISGGAARALHHSLDLHSQFVNLP